MIGRWSLAALPFALAGLLSAASGQSAGAGPACAAAPSNFEYLVLASMADSQHPIAMLEYCPQRRG
jgi:hypothetical protein